MHAYGVPVAGGGPDTTEGLRCTSGSGPSQLVGHPGRVVGPHGTPRCDRGEHTTTSRPRSGTADAVADDLTPGATAAPSGERPGTSRTTTTTTTAPQPAVHAPATSGPSLVSSPVVASGAGAPTTTVPITTTTLPPATTTTTSPATSATAARMQTQGYLDPPLQPSNGYGFTGTGAMQISVLWSGTTYLTLTVSCPSGNQSVGGTSAMAASLADASGNCLRDGQ